MGQLPEKLPSFSETPVEQLFNDIRKTLNPLWIKRFRYGGISRARTYDLHDVNVAL